MPLTVAGFAEFGDMTELPGSEHFPINKGFIVRHHDPATVDVATEGGRHRSTCSAVSRAAPCGLEKVIWRTVSMNLGTAPSLLIVILPSAITTSGPPAVKVPQNRTFCALVLMFTNPRRRAGGCQSVTRSHCPAG